MRLSLALISVFGALQVAFAVPIATAFVSTSIKRDNFDQCPYGFFTKSDGTIQCISPSGQDSTSKRDNPETTTLCPHGWFIYRDTVHCILASEQPVTIKRSDNGQSNAWLPDPASPTPTPAPSTGHNFKDNSLLKENCENAGCAWLGSNIDDIHGQCVCPPGKSTTGDSVAKRQSQQIESCENAGCTWLGSNIDDIHGQCVCPPERSPTGDSAAKHQPQQIESCENAGCTWTGSNIDDIHGKCICPPGKSTTGDKRSDYQVDVWSVHKAPTKTHKRSVDNLPPTWTQGPFGRLYAGNTDRPLPSGSTSTIVKRDYTPEQWGKSWECSVQGLNYDPNVVDSANPYGSCVVPVDWPALGGRNNVNAERSSDDIHHQSTCYSGRFCASIGYNWHDIGGGCGECF